MSLTWGPLDFHVLGMTSEISIVKENYQENTKVVKEELSIIIDLERPPSTLDIFGPFTTFHIHMDLNTEVLSNSSSHKFHKQNQASQGLLEP